VDLVPLARDLVDDARVVAPDRAIALESDGPVVVEGDDPALRQVVGNLIANARVHTPSGTPVTDRVRAGKRRPHGHGLSSRFPGARHHGDITWTADQVPSARVPPQLFDALQLGANPADGEPDEPVREAVVPMSGGRAGVGFT
jgi:hypothetical protein